MIQDEMTEKVYFELSRIYNSRNCECTNHQIIQIKEKYLQSILVK